MIKCPNCGIENPDSAKFCQECGSLLTEDSIKNESKSIETPNKKSPGTAAVLSFLIAGLGFVYIKEYAKAVLSFIIVFMGGVISILIFGTPYILGILLLIFVIFWSYDETKKYNEKLTN